MHKIAGFNWALPLVLACAPLSAASRAPQPAAPGVVIHLLKGNVPLDSVLLRAKSTVTRIFAGIGVPIEWRAAGGESAASIEMQLDDAVPAALHPGALAYSTPYGTSGTRVHVLWDRVVRASPSRNLAGIHLGHVMAHEIAHVLEGINRHSAEGVMKAHWDDHDFYQMAFRPLPFAPQDVALIHAGLDRRQPAD